jgi:hypothetical protein
MQFEVVVSHAAFSSNRFVRATYFDDSAIQLTQTRGAEKPNKEGKEKKDVIDITARL